MFDHLSSSLFEETSEQVEKRETAKEYNKKSFRKWGLRQRDQDWNGTNRNGRVDFSSTLSIRFEEQPGQQQRVWDCSLIMAKLLYSYFPSDFFKGKKVIELGCGVGVPGLTAALLGAKYVALTDMPSAIPFIKTNIALNKAISGQIEAFPLLWGKNTGSSSIQNAYDVILCSDLLYGDQTSSELLVDTIRQLCHPRTLIISVHEARFAGDQGKSFFQLLSDCSTESIPNEAFDKEYCAENIHAHLISMPDNSITFFP